MPSFDTVCEPNMVEVKNAVENCAKEIGTRFDFKGTSAGIELKDKEITLFGDAATAGRVGFAHHPAHERFPRRDAREVPATPQQQRLYRAR